MIHNLCRIRAIVGQVQGLTNQGELLEAIEVFVQLEKQLGPAKTRHRVRAFEVLAIVTNDLRREVVEDLDRKWHDLICINGRTSTVSLPQDQQCESPYVTQVSNVDHLKSLVYGSTRDGEPWPPL